jgi:hypothetical protein
MEVEVGQGMEVAVAVAVAVEEVVVVVVEEEDQALVLAMVAGQVMERATGQVGAVMVCHEHEINYIFLLCIKVPFYPSIVC